MKNKILDLTEGNITKNLIRLSLPIMLANFLQVFYNLTDTFWLGKLGDDASKAVSAAGIAYPLVFFLSSFGAGFVISGTALIAQYKGAGKPEEMKRVVGQYLLILCIFSAVFLPGVFLFIDPILNILQVPAEIFIITKQYVSIILLGMVFMFIFMTYQSISQGLGDTISPMKIQVISVLLNLVLDPLLIFGVGFIPRLETMGAAITTLVARIMTAVFAVIFLIKKSKPVLPTQKDILPDKAMLKRIMSISIPASLGQSVTAFGFLLLQGFVNGFGTAVIAVFSISGRITGFFTMPAMGISSALATVIGQNMGAGKMDRAKESVKKAFVLVMTIMTAGCLVLFFFGGELTRFLIADPEVVEMGKRMFRILTFSSLAFGIVFVFMGVFNGSGHTKPSMILNVIRLWGLRIPFVLLLSGLAYKHFPIEFLKPVFDWFALPLSVHPYDALWWSMVISNSVIALWAFLIYRRGKWQKVRI
ncbi:MAG TPA: MATE family efflux transporter [Candidatus Cloacimonadota bacterium]|nr:MATE family efflux transporter [Candidatus Cloacimonadota bacterium]